MKRLLSFGFLLAACSSEQRASFDSASGGDAGEAPIAAAGQPSAGQANAAGSGAGSTAGAGGTAAAGETNTAGVPSAAGTSPTIEGGSTSGGAAGSGGTSNAGGEPADGGEPTNGGYGAAGESGSSGSGGGVACECTTGQCCDGCYFRPRSFFLGEVVRYSTCRPEGSAADIEDDYWNLFCSGGSASGTRWGGHTKYVSRNCHANTTCEGPEGEAVCAAP